MRAPLFTFIFWNNIISANRDLIPDVRTGHIIYFFSISFENGSWLNMRLLFLDVIVVLFFLPFSYSWSTTIEFGIHFGSRTNILTYSCTSVAPGFCCRNFHGRVPSNLPRQQGIRTSGSFIDLPLGAISAVWELKEGELLTSCNERALETRYDIPHWSYEVRDPLYIGGASYIQCPSARLDIGWTSTLAGLCIHLHKRLWREVPTREDSAAPELAWGYADVITFNGTNYTDERRGDFIYKDTTGNLFNMTLLIGWKTAKLSVVEMKLCKRGWNLRDHVETPIQPTTQRYVIFSNKSTFNFVLCYLTELKSS